MMVQLRDFSKNPNFHRALALQLTTMFAGIQWQLLETLLPKYLTRFYGNEVKWGAVTSINLWICTLAPPLFAAALSAFSDFGVIIPGIAVFAISPLSMLIWPTLWGSVLWAFVMSFGEIVWSPRVAMYITAQSPERGQALFLSLLGSPRVVFNFVGTIAAGFLLERFVPPCWQCQDSLGFFCSENIGGKCHSRFSNEVCAVSDHLSANCPLSCQDCPGWHHNSRVMWATIVAVSVISPLLVTLYRKTMETRSEKEKMDKMMNRAG